MHLGDFDFGKTIHHKFTTVNSSGVPTGFSSGGLTVYGGTATSPSATGITLTSTFNGVTGLSHVKIAMSTTGFYSSANEFAVVVSSGAASEDLSGYVICEFSVGRKSAVVVSTAVTVSTGTAIDSVTSVNSTVDADLRQWVGTAPSTLGTNSHVRVSSTSAIAAVTTAGAVGSVTNNVVVSTGSEASLADTVWDENFSQHDTGGSFGQLLRRVEEVAFIQEGEIVAASSTSVTLGAGSTVDDYYSFTKILITSGDAAGQVRLITDYVGASKVATVGREWTVTPTTSGPDEFSITVDAEGAVKSVLDSVPVSTDSAIDTVGSLSSSGLDAIVLSEPSTGPPAASPTLPAAVSWAHYTLRHQIRVNATGKVFYDSSGNTLWAKGLQGDSATYLELIGSTST